MVVKVPEGEDPVSFFRSKISELGLSGGLIIAIGGFEWAEVGIYKGDGYEVRRVEAEEGKVLEVAPLVGNYVVFGGEVSVHLHVNLGKRHGEVLAGHLLEAKVKPFLEAFLVEAEGVHEAFAHRKPA